MKEILLIREFLKQNGQLFSAPFTKKSLDDKHSPGELIQSDSNWMIPKKRN